jgi:DNA repair exonuclease SbcCD ATPase subunit
VTNVCDIDENIKALHDEILGLSRVSDAIQKTWAANATVIASRAKEDGDLWVAVQESLQDCDDMVQRLESTIRRVSKEVEPSRNLGNKILRAVKLNLKEKEIEQYRKQINSQYVVYHTLYPCHGN